MLVQFSAVEAVNQAWAALAGTRAATVSEKLKDLNQRRRIVNAARTAIGDDDLPLGVRQLGRLLDRDWFIDLVASPDDLRVRARAARVEVAQLDELCGPDVDDDTKRAWVVALAGSVWSISVRDATIVEAVQLAVLNRIDDTLVRVVDIGISTYDLVAQLAAASVTHDAAADQPRPLHNLPQRQFSSFVGRDAEVQQLHRLLRPHPESRHFIAIVDGIGGVGKTSLVSQVAHHYVTHHRELPEPHRFDAVVWVSAKRDVLTADGILQRRFELGELSDLLRAIGNVLGRSDLSQHPPVEQEAIVTDLLTRNRVLLVVDNLETVPDTELVTFLREVPDPTKVLVTSRERIDVAYAIRLTGLEDAEARELVADRADDHGLDLPGPLVDELIRRTGGVPLGLVWSIGLLAIGQSPDRVIRRLGSGQDDIVRFCFSESFRSLTQQSAVDMLLTAAFFDEPVGRVLLGASAGLGPDEYARDDALALLLKLSLLNRHDEQFSLLPLTRTFSLELLRQRRSDETRLRNHWIAAIGALTAGYEVPEYQWRDLRRIRREGLHVESAYRWAREEGRVDLLLRFGPALMVFYDTVGRWDDILSIGPEIESYALSAGRATVRLGSVWTRCWVLGQRGETHTALNLVRSVESDAQSPADRAQYLQCLSQILRWHGDYGGAKAACAEALMVVPTINDPTSDGIQAGIIFELGKIARDTHDWSTAERYFREAAGVFDFDEIEETLAADSTADVPPPRFNIERALGLLGNLGLVQHRRGNAAGALEPLQRSLQYFREHGALNNTVTALLRLADVELDLGIGQAHEHLREARSGAERLGLAEELRQITELEHRIS